MSHLSSFPPLSHRYTPYFLMPETPEYRFIALQTRFNISIGKTLITLHYSLSGPDRREGITEKSFNEFYFYVRLPSHGKFQINGTYYRHNPGDESQWKEFKAGVVGTRVKKGYQGDGLFQYVRTICHVLELTNGETQLEDTKEFTFTPKSTCWSVDDPPYMVDLQGEDVHTGRWVIDMVVDSKEEFVLHVSSM